MNINPLYVLPNLFTAGSIFLGIVSIMLSSNAMFKQACWLIVVSMVLDGLDGRVARITHTSSKFGVELDSLADIVSFGVAPAMLLYFYIGGEYGRYGIEHTVQCCRASTALYVTAQEGPRSLRSRVM